MAEKLVVGKEEIAKANEELEERKEQIKAKKNRKKEKSFVCWETQKRDNKYRFFLFYASPPPIRQAEREKNPRRNPPEERKHKKL